MVTIKRIDLTSAMKEGALIYALTFTIFGVLWAAFQSLLLAGLNDEDRDVKVVCCRLLGKRKEPKAVDPLANLVAKDADLDVRLAAVDALGAMETKASVAGLAAALKDRDPAMQYAGVEAMKKVAPDQEDLGNDVQAWRSYADSVIAPAPAASIATQPGDTSVK